MNSTRPAPVADGPAVRFGPFRLDVANRLLSRDGTELPVPPRAIGVLWCLVARAGRVVSKQEVLDEVWKDAFVSDTSLAEAVSLVRQVLGDDPQQPTYIQTVPRRGYRFVAPVVVEEDPAASSADLTPAAVPGASPAPERLWTPWLPYLLLFVAGVVVGLAAMARTRSAPPPPAGLVRFALDPPQGWARADGRSLAVSPDGLRFAMIVRRPGERTRLALRRLDSETITLVTDSDGAGAPAFSPDGRRVAFFAGGRLLTVAADGGIPTPVADAPSPLGAAWVDSSHIVFASRWTGGLDIVDVSRGGVRPLTHADASLGEVRHAWPALAASADVVTFSIAHGLDAGGSQPAWISLRTGAITRLALAAADVRPIGEDRLLLLRPGASAVVAVDRRWTGSTGEPVNLPDVVPIDELSGGAAVAISGNGVRVAADGGADAMRDAKWVGDGVDDADVTGLRGLEDRAVSPDGRRVAAVERQVGRATLWVVDLISGVRVRVAAARRLASPVWAPDNRTLAVGLSDGGPFALAITHVDRSDAPRILAHDTRGLLPSCWTPDAARLLAMRATSDRGWDIVAIPAAGGTLSSVVAGNADDVRAVVSPDGAHLAYLSNASGDWTLLVRRLDSDGPALAIAPDVRSVAWTGAATLLYATGDRLVRVTLSIGDGGMEAGPSRTIATGIARVARGAAPDDRVLATMRGDRSRGAHVSLGWLEALRAQLAANEPMPKSFR